MTEGVVALVVVLTFTGNLYTIIIRIFTGGKQMTTISTLAEYINCIEKFDSVFVFRFEDNHYDDIWDLENNNSQEVQKLKNSKYQKAQNVYNYLRNKDLYNDNLTGSERQRLISSVREEVLEARDELYAQAFYKRYAPIDHAKRFYFRGLANEKYLNAPGIYRKDLPEEKSENYFYNEIQVRCPLSFAGMKNINKLTYMQHYGCPTRLLDISSNPLLPFILLV